ncbi:transthyretin-like family protein [Schlesneria paludicola]|uniref:hypothetical protein n=1 Tax=Schlesneria paludicola TaxID=360056 RepID=UPI00029B252F|nr:hypothetical protein [Schlesneria paludicola]
MTFRRLFPFGPAMMAVIVASGCSNSELIPPKTVPVSGSVTYKGKPAAGVRVKFHPQFNIGKLDFVPYGETGADGKYVLSTGKPGNGAPKGEYLVTLEMPYIGVDPQDGLESELDRLKGVYSDPYKNNWTVILNDGENVLDPFQIQ